MGNFASEMKLYIKNMVCSRCKLVVQTELQKLGYEPTAVELGEVTVEKEISGEEKERISEALLPFGFELIDDKKSRIIEQIKKLVIETIHYSGEHPKTNYSDFIADHLHHDYSYLSNLFSSVEGTTIEKYIIEQKIERVKELLVYDELSLAEIADQLGYSSTAHLSSQFKKVTGLTPSYFKKLGAAHRKPLEDL